MRHVLAILVDNNAGVLQRVAGLFRRRGFNIDSLAVGVTEDPAVSRMTVVIEGDAVIVDQLTRQLRKFVEVRKVSEMPAGDAIARELALIKVRAEGARRSQVLQVAEIFRARVVDVSRGSVVLEATGTQDKIDALLSAVREFGVLELQRTGVIALDRGKAGMAADAVEPEVRRRLQQS